MLAHAVAQAKKFVVAHVSGEFLTNVPRYREEWWEEFQANGGVIERYENMPLAAGQGIKRCAWMYFFKNAKNSQAILQGTRKEGDKSEPSIKQP